MKNEHLLNNLEATPEKGSINDLLRRDLAKSTAEVATLRLNLRAAVFAGVLGSLTAFVAGMAVQEREDANTEAKPVALETVPVEPPSITQPEEKAEPDEAKVSPKKSEPKKAKSGAEADEKGRGEKSSGSAKLSTW